MPLETEIKKLNDNVKVLDKTIQALINVMNGTSESQVIQEIKEADTTEVKETKPKKAKEESPTVDAFTTLAHKTQLEYPGKEQSVIRKKVREIMAIGGFEKLKDVKKCDELDEMMTKLIDLYDTEVMGV